ncbi:MAG: N-acetyltransferase [Clostridia bacterium]|nr:N-acetyltransferase [Clostridia bacterium]
MKAKERNMEFIREEGRIYSKDANGKVIAEIEFEEIKKGLFDIYHTFVDESLRGKGVASKLVQEAVKEIQARNGKIQATCSYAKKWLEHNKL